MSEKAAPIHCPDCSFENPVGFRFCGSCGGALPSPCGACGFVNPPDFGFCGKCGQQLGAAAATPAERKPEAPAAEAEPEDGAERRQLTVMFCDLADSTALSEQLDPEDLRDLVRRYQAVCVESVEPFEGHVAQYLGDGILVYFGYPTAHEDDARRAIHAGLGIQAGIERLNGRLERESGTRIGVRIGIHTGAVVAGDVGEGESVEQLAMGRTPNVAARLQGLADHGSVVVSDATARLVSRNFEFDSLGEQTLKGISHPVVVHRVVRETAAAAASPAPSVKTPLVGRDREMAFLLQTLAQSDRGKNQTVLLSAEAGIGKTRLLEAFRNEVGNGSYRWLVGQASAYHKASAYYPLLDCFRHDLLAAEAGTEEEKRAQVEDALAGHPTLPDRGVPLLLSFFGFSPGDDDPRAGLTPDRRKSLTQEALLALMTALGGDSTLIVVMEDLHWADPSSLEFLQLMLERPPLDRLLCLFTFRPEFESPWSFGSRVSQVTLDRLDREEIESLTLALAGTQALPKEILEQVIARTDGVPLFVEELTRAVVESGFLVGEADGAGVQDASRRLNIPDTVRGLLTARLDELGKGKRLAQIASVFGREFAVETLAAVLEQDPETTRRSIQPLLEAQILAQRGASSYGFRHALIQESAYGSLLRRTRRNYHRRIARTLAERFPEEVESRPEGLARHLTEAGLAQEAIQYWFQAGRRDLQSSANLEAIEHLKSGLALLPELPAGEGRDQLELAMMTMTGTAMSITRGYAAPEVEEMYVRAEAICERLPDSDATFWALRVISSFYVVSGRYDRVLEIGEHLSRAAQMSDDPTLAMEAHLANGVARYYLGQLDAARALFESGLALDTPERERISVNFTATETRVMTVSHLAWTLWLLGYPDEALARCQEALESAREFDHPMTLQFALYYSAWLHQMRGEVEETAECVAEVFGLAERFGSFLLPHVAVLEGWSISQRESGAAEGLAKIQEGYDLFCLSGQLLERTHYATLLAEAQIKTGNLEEAAANLDEAERVAEQCGEVFWRTEILRLRVRLKRASAEGSSDDRELREQLERGLSVARETESRSLELRVATDLAELLATAGEWQRARKVLEESRNRLTEGLDTADLRRASTLMENLTAERGISHAK